MYYTHHYLLFEITVFLIANYDEQNSYDLATSTDSTSRRPKVLLKPDSVLILIPTNFLQKDCKKPKIFLFVVQFHRRRPCRNLPYKTYKKPPRAKRPPTADRAERLTLFRESRSTLLTSVNFLLSQQPTSPQNSV